VEALTELLAAFQKRLDDAKEALARCRHQVEGDGDDSPCWGWESVVQEREDAYNMLRQTVDSILQRKGLQ
jgi:hypothetical protein